MTFIIGTPHVHNAGYFYNDDRASGGQKHEDDVRTCKHCEGVILMREWKKEGGWCARCNSPLCSAPACMAETARLGCVPFTKKLEQQMAQSQRLSQIIQL